MERVTLNANAPKPTAHLYGIGATNAQGERVSLAVHANNRDHAARIAERAGYTVRDVNMEG
jgi:hypothetical protein